MPSGTPPIAIVSFDNNNNNKEEYNRISCIHCRKNHKKCDRKLPSCARCTKLNKQCMYANIQYQPITVVNTTSLSSSTSPTHSISPQTISPLVMSNYDTQGMLNRMTLSATLMHSQFLEFCCLGCNGVTPSQKILSLLYNQQSQSPPPQQQQQIISTTTSGSNSIAELLDSALLLSVQCNVLQCIGQKQLAKLCASQSEQKMIHLLSLSTPPQLQYNIHVTLLYLCKYFLGTALQNDGSYHLFMHRAWLYLQTNPNLDMIELYAKIETIYKMLHCLQDPFTMMEIFSSMPKLPDTSNTLPQFETQVEVQVANIMKQVLQDLQFEKLKESILVLEECVMIIIRSMEHILRQETFVNKMGFYNERIIEYGGKASLYSIKIQILQSLLWQQNLHEDLIAFLKERIELASKEILEITKMSFFGYFNPTCIGPIYFTAMYYLSVQDEEHSYEEELRQLHWAMQCYEKRYDWIYRQPFSDVYSILQERFLTTPQNME